MDLKIRVCTEEDLDLLAVLNKQLIEDEQHDNKMSFDQLRERMQGFLHSNYRAYLFENGAQTIGYALVDHARQPLYLRQFFICREVRRKGYGKIAFHQLLNLLATECIDLEVLSWNEKGIKFWRAFFILGSAQALYIAIGFSCEFYKEIWEKNWITG